MTITEIKRLVRKRKWILDPIPDGWMASATTQFQVKRRTEAVRVARVYLAGLSAAEIGAINDVTPERAAQVVRLGIDVMLLAGHLKPRSGREKSA